MTKEEFEQLISDNAHKNEILRLVEESICMLPCKDERNHPKPTVLYVPQYVANFVSKKSCSI